MKCSVLFVIVSIATLVAARDNRRPREDVDWDDERALLITVDEQGLYQETIVEARDCPGGCSVNGLCYNIAVGKEECDKRRAYDALMAGIFFIIANCCLVCGCIYVAGQYCKNKKQVHVDGSWSKPSFVNNTDTPIGTWPSE